MDQMNKTQKIIPIGRIFTNMGNYFLIKPRPLPADWEAEGMDYRFLVVPFNGGNHAMREYPCPREVVFICDIQVEYATDISAINCELPYDILDNQN
jgi:hypothetical protein